MCQAVSRPSSWRGSSNTSGHWAKPSDSRAKFRFRAARLTGSFWSWTSPNAALSSEGSKFQPTSSKMNRLSYSRSPSISLKKRLSTPLAEP